MSGTATGLIRSKSPEQAVRRKAASKLGLRHAKLHRLQRKGLLPTKAELERLCHQAVQSYRKP